MGRIQYFEPLTDEELDKITANDLEALKAFYKILRRHHIDETTELWNRVEILAPGSLAKLKRANR